MRSDWQELSEMGPQYDDLSDVFSEVVDKSFWLSRGNIWTEDELNQLTGWIDCQRSASDFIMEDCPVVYPEQLNPLQRFAFEIIKEHELQQKQLLFILLGAAGSGKTFTIHAISTFLHGQLKRAAPTAKAAFLINGDTIHQMLAIKTNEGNKYIPLAGERLKNLQVAFENIKYVIVDEYSMLSQTMLYRIDQRMRQITQRTDRSFGGLSIILTGDPGQLLPVAAPCLYDQKSNTAINIGGFELYKSFKLVVQLTQLMRQINDGDDDQKKFIELLPRLRNGDCTKEDFNLLRKRFYGPDKQLEFKDAPRIYALNDSCHEHNMFRLKENLNPITISTAINFPVRGKNFDADQFRGLQNNLYISIGAKIVITSNVWKKYGITNGSSGIIMDIVYKDTTNGLPEQPDILIIKLDRYSGPQAFSQPHRRNWVPFDAESAFNPRSNSTRKQFPIRLSYAITVHKAQGETLSKGVIDFGVSEKSLGSSYVQLTRFKKFSQFCILPFSFDRITKVIKNSLSLKPRMIEEDRLDKLSLKTFNDCQHLLPHNYNIH
jgi:ATP-dependent DNA helicase PIF1